MGRPLILSTALLLGTLLIPSATASVIQEGSVSGAIYTEDGSTLITDVKYAFESSTQEGNYVTYCAGDGHFSADLALGSYKVFAQGDSEDCGGDPNYVREYWREKTSWAQADVITLTSESPSVTGVNFTLSPGGSLSGHIYEQDGVTPVQGACVNVSFTAPEWSQIKGYCCTDADGGFTISGLPEGELYVKTHADCDGKNPDLIDEWYADDGSTADGDLATPVTVVAGETTFGVDFALGRAASIGALEYQVSVHDPATRFIEVTLVVSNVTTDDLLLETSEFRGRFIAPQNLLATNPEGQTLPVTPVSDDEAEGLAWSISMQGNSQATISYKVNPATVIGSGEVHGYLSDQFGVAEGQTLFLVPANEGEQSMQPSLEIGDVRVKFSVPSGWEVCAPWRKAGEYYYPDTDRGMVLKHLCFAPIALGGFDFVSRTISGTQVTVVCVNDFGTTPA